MQKQTAIIGLGSSIGDKKYIFDSAVEEIKKLGENFRVSSYMETQPIGGVAKNTFLNAVCCFDCDLEPFELLEKLQKIEKQFGRERNQRWEDRTLDLDILYYGINYLQTTKLTIPHPEIKNRDFVMEQIRELFPYFYFGDKKKIVMGILNITPDSFFDGGKYIEENDYKQQVETMCEQGIDIIDVGGFSSRPGSVMPSVEEELTRILPVLDFLEERNLPFSVDTCRSEVVEKIIHYKNIVYINDISGGTDEKVFDILAKNTQVGYVLMHTQGTPEMMQNNPSYTDVVSEVYSFFQEKIQVLQQKGIKNIVLDPGFGFGKTIEHNYELLSKLEVFQSLGYPLFVGVSRKSMMYKLLDSSPQEVLPETSALHLLALQKGAQILRVHDVKEAKNIVKMFDSMR